MTTINLPDNDAYPETLEALGKVFQFAHNAESLSEDELDVLNHLQASCINVLNQLDPDSLKVMLP